MNFIKNNHYLLFALVLFIGFSFIVFKKLENEVSYEQIVVSQGDTLWTYSKEYGDNIPTKQWIDEVVKVNELTSTTIRAGEKLKIPIRPHKIPSNQIATNLAEEVD